MSSAGFRRPLAAVLVALFLLAGPAARAQALDAALSGRVFAADGLTPRSGVTVHLVRGEGETIVSSPATDGDGTFAIDGATAGTYSILVETEQGAFVAPEPLELQAGANPPLALSLAAAVSQDAGLGSSGQEMRPWVKWLIIGVITATGLYVISEVTDSEEPSSSF